MQQWYKGSRNGFYHFEQLCKFDFGGSLFCGVFSINWGLAETKRKNFLSGHNLFGWSCFSRSFKAGKKGILWKLQFPLLPILSSIVCIFSNQEQLSLSCILTCILLVENLTFGFRKTKGPLSTVSCCTTSLSSVTGTWHRSLTARTSSRWTTSSADRDTTCTSQPTTTSVKSYSAHFQTN